MDEIREEFEKIWIQEIKSWNPQIHFVEDKYYPISASYDPCAANEINRTLLIFKALHKSRDEEIEGYKRNIKHLDGINNDCIKELDKQQAEIKKLEKQLSKLESHMGLPDLKLKDGE